MPVIREAMEAIVKGHHGQPFHVLGPHAVAGGGALELRTFQPDAKSVELLDGKSRRPLATFAQLHPEGFFEARLPLPKGEKTLEPYLLRFVTKAGQSVELYDPYQFEPLLTRFDRHLLGEGTHARIWERLGAHPHVLGGVAGVNFALWAPNARRVSVVGDFNSWDGRRHPMRRHEDTGIWELFIPGLAVGENYKYELLPENGPLPFLKADPLAFYAELAPKTASRIFDLAGYEWRDAGWMAARAGRDFTQEPISIYEVHLGSWRRVPEERNRPLTYRELAASLVPYVKDMGYTHVEFMPVSEHPYYGSWGYQTTSLFAPTSRYGSPHDFMALVDAFHAAGIGVILDWVPAHFPKDAHGLANFDGTHLYEHADPRQGLHPDWDTLVFNFGRTEVRNFLLANALFWLETYHLDGLRVDAVASMLYLDYSRKQGEWIPNRYGGNENLEAISFLKRMNELVHAAHPGVLTIAEESTAFPGVSRPTYLGGLGFSLKWNMGWMHDTLDYFSKDPVHRKYHSNKLTFGMLYAYTENFVLALSHDEVVHGKSSLIGKMPGDAWQKHANLRALMGFMYGHPGKKLNFMGSELGQWTEWDHDASLSWHLLQFPAHQGMQRWIRDLNHVLRAEPALHERDFSWEGFKWIDCNDVDRSIYSFARFGKQPEEALVFICNLTPVVRHGYRVGVPAPGLYDELLNSDAALYGGGNVGNEGCVTTEARAWQGYPQSLVLTLPPLATLILKRRER